MRNGTVAMLTTIDVFLAETSVISAFGLGHILFEMCSGYELYAPKPTARHLEDLQAYPQVV